MFRAIQIPKIALENRSIEVGARVKMIEEMLFQVGYYNLLSASTYCLFIHKDIHNLTSSRDQEYQIGELVISIPSKMQPKKTLPFGNFLKGENTISENNFYKANHHSGQHQRLIVWIFILSAASITCCGTIVLLFVRKVKVGSMTRQAVDIEGNAKSVRRKKEKKKKKKKKKLSRK